MGRSVSGEGCQKLFCCLSVKLQTEENKVHLADWQQMTYFLELILALARVRNSVASCVFPHSLSLSLSLSVIAAEIYSEIFPLTPTALVLNERPVKLMGQIQSFLVTHFTTHTHIHTHSLTFSSCWCTHPSPPFSFCLLQIRAASGHGFSFMGDLITALIKVTQWVSSTSVDTLMFSMEYYRDHGASLCRKMPIPTSKSIKKKKKCRGFKKLNHEAKHSPSHIFK